MEHIRERRVKLARMHTNCFSRGNAGGMSRQGPRVTSCHGCARGCCVGLAMVSHGKLGSNAHGKTHGETRGETRGKTHGKTRDQYRGTTYGRNPRQAPRQHPRQHRTKHHVRMLVL